MKTSHKLMIEKTVYSQVATAVYYTACMFSVLMFEFCDRFHPLLSTKRHVNLCLFSVQSCYFLFSFEFAPYQNVFIMLYMFHYTNNALFALFWHVLLLLCICPFAHYMRIDYIPRMVQRDNNCMCCSSWLQYRICHSLSTIQYVLVPQVQRQLQAALLHAAGSESRSRSRSGPGSRPRSPLQLRRGGRDHQAEGPPQDQLRNSQCQDSRETHTCQGEKEMHISYMDLKKLWFLRF